jgi:hypothetical protein
MRTPIIVVGLALLTCLCLAGQTNKQNDGGQSGPSGRATVSGRQTKPAPRAWWSARQAGLVGGIAGTAFGCVGGLIGVLSGLGRARRLVLGLAKGMIVFGLGCLALMVAALLQAQPFWVYYPLGLMGAISVVVCGFLLPTIRRRYEQLELRKMQAMDTS